MTPLISVIVPVYKVEEYLPKCVDSIRNQTYQNLEIILIDDGSPDRCPAMCDQFAMLDGRIRVIHQENGGLSAARNAGLDIMQGEYLMFVDSDDWLSLDAIQTLYDRLERDNSDMAIGQMVKVYDDGHTEPSYCAWMKDMVITGKEALTMLGTKWPIPCYAWGSLIKYSVYSDLRFCRLRRAEDVWILPHVLNNCRKITLESRILYYYYQRSSSIVHSSADAQWLDSAAASFHVCQYLMERALWDNAAVYCETGMLYLQNVSDTKKARHLVAESFSWKEWIQLSNKKLKCSIYAVPLCAPGLYKILKMLRQIIKQEC